jgi:hypothetical protein
MDGDLPKSARGGASERKRILVIGLAEVLGALGSLAH